MVFNHPELVKWFFRNKVRTSGLDIEQQTDRGYSKYPLGITFKPTLSCNLRCKMCSFVTSGAVFTNPKDSLGLDVWKGVVDDVKQTPPGALLRLDQPGPGIAALFIMDLGETVLAAFSFYLYGAQAAANVARETPRWQAWIQERFPMPAEQRVE